MGQTNTTNSSSKNNSNTSSNIITPPIMTTSPSRSSLQTGDTLFRSNFASSPSSAKPVIPPFLSSSSSLSKPSSSLSSPDQKTPSSSPFSFSFSSSSTFSPSSSTIQYDHETYLELLAGKSNSVEKTASQIYREERARQLSLRAQDPAVLSGPMDLDHFATHGQTGGYYGDEEAKK